MMIESALTLHAIVEDYRANSKCSDDTFEMMVETWAEQVFAQEFERPTLIDQIERVDGECSEAVEVDLMRSLAWDTPEAEKGLYTCENGLPGRSVADRPPHLPNDLMARLEECQAQPGEAYRVPADLLPLMEHIAGAVERPAITPCPACHGTGQGKSLVPWLTARCQVCRGSGVAP